MPAGATAHDDKFSKTTAATIYFKEQATNRAKKKQNYHIQSIFKKPIYQHKGPQILSHARNQSL